MSIELQFTEEVAVITFNREKSLNALSFALLAELESALDDVADSSARVLVITGRGDKAFCAGADVKELYRKSLVEHRRGVELGQAVFSKIENLAIPSIAMINGYAFGGGMEVALACTFRLASPNAKFGLPEVKLGLIPGYGGTQRLPRLVGQSRALEIILTGKTMSAKEALDIGLINRVVESANVEAAIAFSQDFICYSRLTVNFARNAVMRAFGQTMTEGLKIEADLSCQAYCTGDAAEGILAFIESRKPTFRDC